MRGVAIAALVLAATVVTPALSAAQEDGGEPVPEPAAGSPAAAPLPEPGAAPPPSKPNADPKPNGGSKPVAEGGSGSAPEQAAPPSRSGEPSAVPASAGGSGARAAASATVSIGDNFYAPPSVSIAVGDTVTWANNGQAQHSATADNGSFDTGVFGPGSSRSETFNQAGTFSYFCTVHGQIQSGTVRVLAASGGGGNGGGGGGGGSGGSGTAGTSEADAVASPDAAGTGTSLAATGLESLGLVAIGIALLVSGIALRAGLGYRVPLL
jgi:plastocyanin